MHRRGFEPLTSRFVAVCSIQLSYRCIKCSVQSSQTILFSATLDLWVHALLRLWDEKSYTLA